VSRARIGYGPAVADKTLGALPVVAEFARRLDLAGIVDRACPVRDLALLTHGQVIEALVANRLTSPAPLVHVEQWAREWAVEEIFGIDPAALNDDRIGRALDAIAPQLAGIVGSVGAAAIGTFGLDAARLHWDMTSISLFGAYADPQAGFAAPRFGHPKDRRTDLKQIQAGLAVTGDGGVPVFHRAYHGGAGEIAQVTGAMEALRKLAGPRTFGDGRGLQTDLLRQRARPDRGRRGVHRPRVQDLREGHHAGRAAPAGCHRRGRGGLHRPTRPRQASRAPRSLAGPGRHHDAARPQGQQRTGPDGAPGLRLVLPPRQCRPGRPQQEARQGPR